MQTQGLRPRALLGAVITRASGSASRLLRLGEGSTIGGRIGLVVEPRLLEALASGREITVVSGTNGKTTTTSLIVAALGGGGHVVTSDTGANLPAGLVGALAGAPAGTRAVLEVDEAYVPRVLTEMRPKLAVLLNLSRDQLDRVSEVRMLASRWRDALADFPGTVVANADDPLVAWAALRAHHPVFVAAGGTWREDANHCPSCDGAIVFETETPGNGEGPSWRCTSCALRRPELSARLGIAGLEIGGLEPLPLEIGLPGRFNQANAAMAVIAAGALGVPFTTCIARLAKVLEVAGRYAVMDIGHGRVRLLLAKNPAGWTELLEELSTGKGLAVLAINARGADGHDPSWLWDVPFERLGDRALVASGERALDLAVRLRHAGLAHEVKPNIEDALRAARPSADRPGSTRSSADRPPPVDFVGNYTAFQELRRLSRRHVGLATRSIELAREVRSRARHGPTRARTPGRLTPGRLTLGQPKARPVVTGRRSTGHPTGSHDSALRVVVVHPDLLGTYGDGGNGLVLANRALWRGLDVELLLASSDRPLPESGDLYCLGGGEDGPQLRAAALLARSPLARAIDGGAVLLAVCAGFQIVGESFSGPGGTVHKGVGILDARTVRGNGPRAVGEVLALPVQQGIGTLSGFENHAGRTVLGTGAAPLAMVRQGFGNDGSGREGALVGKIVATYLHGPLLARNPSLADFLLGLATGQDLEPLDDPEEHWLRAERLAAAERRIVPGKASLRLRTPRAAPRRPATAAESPRRTSGP